MWATAPLPYYSADGRATSTGNRDASPPPTSINQPSPARPHNVQPFSNEMSNLLEPALDGPPSPERNRALSKQMQRATAMDKHKSNATTSSGSSSSLRSFNQDRRPSWEHSLETITLSRRSSGRSNSSTMQSRDRPESVQLFGKTIFSRRAKMKRENSSIHSSSLTSLHSGELALDGPTSASKDHFMPAIFGRRRTVKQDGQGDDPALARKLQISGPYNFQHVTHTRRDHLPDLQRGSCAELVTEFSAIRAGQRPTTGSLKGIDVEDLHFSHHSSDALNMQQENVLASKTHAELFMNRPPVIPRQTGPAPAPRHPMKQTRSQEQLRSSPPRPAPPRPPRSPIENEAFEVTSVPPPRISSRLPLQQDGSDDVATDEPLDQDRTSVGAQQPDFLEAPVGLANPLATPSEPVSQDADPHFSHAITTPNTDAAWPLTASTSDFSHEAPLPDVPEEEEVCVVGRHSLTSLASTNSSLRGSQSVPALRQQAQAQGDRCRRPPSGASDTLGGFDLSAAQSAMDEAFDNERVAEATCGENWEDDIDYCYEHEAEANCDYAWERPSLDLVREHGFQAALDMDNKNTFVASLPVGLKPVPTGYLDVPALSPSSATSTSNPHEAITPIFPNLPVRSNFSHPRMETNYRGQSHHVRSASHASSFKESHGFTLSPSLLIPGDFHQQMSADSDTDEFSEDIKQSRPFSFDAEPAMAIEAPGLFIRDRASISTTYSNSSGRTGSTEARHTSTTSTWTASTRYTGSTTFESWNPKIVEGSDHRRCSRDDDFPELGSPRGRKSVMSPLPEFEETLTTSHSTGNMRAITQRNHASLSRESLPLTETKEPMRLPRRQRARTTSLSTPPPPGQYALFPSAFSGGPI